MVINPFLGVILMLLVGLRGLWMWTCLFLAIRISEFGFCVLCVSCLVWVWIWAGLVFGLGFEFGVMGVVQCWRWRQVEALKMNAPGLTLLLSLDSKHKNTKEGISLIQEVQQVHGTDQLQSTYLIPSLPLPSLSSISPPTQNNANNTYTETQHPPSH